MKIALCLAEDAISEDAAALVTAAEAAGITLETFYPSLPGEDRHVAAFGADWTLMLERGHGFEPDQVFAMIELGEDYSAAGMTLSRA